MLGLDALLAGMCARRRSHFLFVSPKKSNQRKRRPHWPCPLRFASGQPAMLGRGAALRNSLRACALRSDNRSESEHEARHAARPRPPHALRFSARPEGRGSPYGPSLRSALVSSGLCFARRASCSLSRWRERAGVRVKDSKTIAACARPLWVSSNFVLRPFTVKRNPLSKCDLPPRKPPQSCDLIGSTKRSISFSFSGRFSQIS